ncbi:MAG: ferrochelatase [Actinomyces sp.]|nr:MAG: ferrochelatase [Actinomyces sp.]
MAADPEIPTGPVTPGAATPDSGALPDAVVVVSFGGPESPDQVLPFLEHVTAGRGVPPARLAAVAERYLARGGVSPLPAQVRRLARELGVALGDATSGPPVAHGFLHSPPFVSDVLAELAAAGHHRVVAVTTSPYGSPSSCRTYRLALAEGARRARTRASAPLSVRLVPRWWDRPAFLAAVADAVRAALRRFPAPERPDVRLVATAHSIPLADARRSPYVDELRTLADRLAHELGREPRDVDLVWQSRSGPPHVPWLEPDIGDHLRALADSGVERVLLVPLGFVTDHFEVIWDLDVEARAVADETGIHLERAVTPGTDPDPRLVQLWRDLVIETALAAPTGDEPDPTCSPACCVDDDLPRDIHHLSRAPR